MLNFDTTTKKIINSLTVDTFTLFELYYDTASEPLRLTDLSGGIMLNGVGYAGAAISRTAITSGSNGQVNGTTVSVANADRVMQSYVENYKLSGKRLRIYEMFVGASGYIQHDYVIKTADCTSKKIDFSCGAGYDVFLMTVPARKLMRDFCSWQFKGSDCGYIGADTVCSKQFNDCMRKGNVSHFGGMPAMVTSRVFV